MSQSSKPRWDPFAQEWEVEPDPGEMVRIVRRSLRIPEHQDCRLEPFAEGAYNKLFKVSNEAGDVLGGGSYLLRVTLPVCNMYKTLSEVATIRFVQQATHIPTPIIIDYDASDQNDLGFEWILMESLPGTPLNQLHNLSTQTREDLTRTLADYQAQLYRRVNGFDSMGSLFVATPDETDSQRHGELTHVFAPGPVVNLWDFSFADGCHHNPTGITIGPRTTMNDAVDESHLPFENEIKRWESLTGEQYDSKRIESSRKLLTELKELSPLFYPKDEHAITRSYLYHADLGEQNILVNEEGKITGIIDWECSVAVPLYLQHDYPLLLQSEQRDTEPNKQDYEDADPDDQEWNDIPGFDDEGKVEIYWTHMEEWKRTQLRKIYDGEMHRLCPELKMCQRERDLLLELKVVYNHLAWDDWNHDRIRRWMQDVREGKTPSQREVMKREESGE